MRRFIGRSPAGIRALIVFTVPMLLAIQPASQTASSGASFASDSPSLLRQAGARPIIPSESWRGIYHQVERCAGMVGDYDAIRWGAMEAPLQGTSGMIYAFTAGSWIVLERDDTIYLRHEMLHHVLTVAGWRPRQLAPGERYTIADLHPMPLFGLCTGGR